MTLSNVVTQGRCHKCASLKAKQAMGAHLQKCLSNPGGKETVFLLAESAYRKPYWMYIALRTDATMEELDLLLRDVWVECCGHLSLFSTPSGEIVSEGFCEDGLEPGQREMDKTRAGDVLKAGMKLAYEYDMGSTTHLKIKVVGLIPMNIGKKAAAVLARNEPPEAICDKCGSPAKFIVAAGMSGDDNKAFCAKCAKDIDEDKMPLLPLVNSPRTGECGYTGSPCE